MTSLSKPFRGVAFVMALVLGGCSSSNSGGTDPGTTSGDCKAGKNAAFATPAGAPFSLPAGVTLDGEMTGDVDPNCGSNHIIEYGGDYLPVCIGIKNAGTADVTVTLPAGLTFIAKNPMTQNGIILQKHDLVAKAGKTTYFYLRLFCLDEHCIYGGKTDTFTFGNVSNDPGIAELISLAASKMLLVGSDVSGALVLGVWDVTDGDGLTAEHRAAIQQAN